MPYTFKRALQSLLSCVLILAMHASYAAPHNGFDISDSIIDKELILVGGPPRDGIPAIHNPVFIKASEAAGLQPGDRVLGIQLQGISKAYPIGILNWHEIVNDEINGTAFAVTYCPLCGTGVVFSAEVDEKNLVFGVSGLLYNSDVLLYDHLTESLWSQILSRAVSGRFKGKKLEKLPVTHTSWSRWVASHPNTLVLSEKTGYSRDYGRNPYDGYETSRALYFQVSNRAPSDFHPKERVLGLQVGDRFKAYPLSEIDKVKSTQIRDSFGGLDFIIHWNRRDQQAVMKDLSGKQVPVIEGFWFAWFAFHPDTEVFTYKP